MDVHKKLLVAVIVISSIASVASAAYLLHGASPSAQASGASDIIIGPGGIPIKIQPGQPPIILKPMPKPLPGEPKITLEPIPTVKPEPIPKTTTAPGAIQTPAPLFPSPKLELTLTPEEKKVHDKLSPTFTPEEEKLHPTLTPEEWKRFEELPLRPTMTPEEWDEWQKKMKEGLFPTRTPEQIREEKNPGNDPQTCSTENFLEYLGCRAWQTIEDLARKKTENDIKKDIFPPKKESEPTSIDMKPISDEKSILVSGEPPCSYTDHPEHCPGSGQEGLPQGAKTPDQPIVPANQNGNPQGAPYCDDPMFDGRGYCIPVDTSSDATTQDSTADQSTNNSTINLSQPDCPYQDHPERCNDATTTDPSYTSPYETPSNYDTPYSTPLQQGRPYCDDPTADARADCIPPEVTADPSTNTSTINLSQPDCPYQDHPERCNDATTTDPSYTSPYGYPSPYDTPYATPLGEGGYSCDDPNFDGRGYCIPAESSADPTTNDSTINLAPGECPYYDHPEYCQ